MGNRKAMNVYMNRVAFTIFSYFDTGKRPSGQEPERFYHGFVLGLMVDLQREYIVTSNRESGFGRYDVVIEPKNPHKNPAIIIEFKVRDNEDEKTLQEQIELSKAAGLAHVKPHKDHMFSNVGLVVLANTISPEAKKLIKRTHFRKNYKLTFHGWTEYQLAAMETSTNSFFSNPAGKEAKKNMERNFAPQK